MARLLFLQNLEYEFLGPMYISSMARLAGHQVRLEIADGYRDFEAAIRDFQPDLIGFSVMTGSHRWARDLAREIKRRTSIPCIFGGAHPTFFPEFAREEGVDLLVRGEGEETVREILGRIDEGKPYDDVPNLVFERNGQLVSNPMRDLRRHLDDYPAPDRRLYDALDGRLDRSVRNVITSRGCPFHCSFCFEDAMRELYAGKGRYVRIREISRVIEELRELRDSAGVRTIYFADDVFGMSRGWLYEFLPIYRREIGLPFICLVRADLVAAHPDYAERLAEAGCRSVFFGVESGNPEIRNRVLAKRLSDEQIRTAADRLHAAGITFRTYNIVGLPGETLEDAYSTLQLNIDIETDYPWCSVFMPFPGTALTRYAFDQGYLDRSFEFDSLSRSFFTESQLDMRHSRELENLQKFFQTGVLWPWTLPLIRRLVRLRPNPLFTAWFGLIYFTVYLRSENKRFLESVRFAIRNAHHVLTRE